MVPLPTSCARREELLARCLSGDCVGLDFARQIEIARLDPRQLARAGAREAAWRDQLDDRADAGDRADALADLVAQAATLFRVGHAAMDEDRGGFFARWTGDREGGDVAGLKSGQLLDRPF